MIKNVLDTIKYLELNKLTYFVLANNSNRNEKIFISDTGESKQTNLDNLKTVLLIVGDGDYHLIAKKLETDHNDIFHVDILINMGDRLQNSAEKLVSILIDKVIPKKDE